MQTEARRLLSRAVGIVILTLSPVVVIAFVAMPMSLDRHPDGPVPTDPPLRCPT